MPKLRLSEMNPVQARKHYNKLVLRRFDDATSLRRAASEVSDKKLSRKMRRDANKLLDKAYNYCQPSEYHIDIALKHKANHGAGVAAAYLAAHNWPVDQAHELLFDTDTYLARIRKFL